MMGVQRTKTLNYDGLKQKKSTKQEKQNELKNRWGKKEVLLKRNARLHVKISLEYS